MSEQGFLQAPPALANTYDTDRALRMQLERLLPAETRAAIEPELRALGERAAGEMLALAHEAERDTPSLITYDAWGRRIDQLVVSPAWQRLVRIAAEVGTIAAAYERKSGPYSRIHQLALIHLYSPSSATASCPMAMTDGAARTMETTAAGLPFAERALAHLTSRDPNTAWTAGQWMTEKEGGSDVGRTSTVARQDGGGQWRLYGTKFFTSATTAECALTLARPEGASAGSRGLSLFYLEPWRADGTLNHIRVRRLKDKLGTRALPTAELELDGALAYPIGDIGSGGVRNIATVLNLTRYWNAANAVAGMRRAIALAIDYAHRRESFGAPIIEHPLHAETLAGLQVEYEGGLAMVLRLAELIGRSETGVASERDEGVLRLLTPLAKLFTGKQAVAVASEALECFGGNGYMEDTGLARLLRDAQVLPIWEGTTNILSLDTFRAIAREEALAPFLEDALARLDRATDARLGEPVQAVRSAVQELGRWFGEAAKHGPHLVQLGARRFAFGLSRTYIAALLTETAAWALATHGDTRPLVTAKRWVDKGLVELRAPTAETLAQARSLVD